MRFQDFHTELGIPEGYGSDPVLPSYAEPAELVEVEPNIVGRVQRLAPETARDWRAMKLAAEAAGIRLLIVSGFRSLSDQADLIRRKVASGQAIAAILSVNAAPGFSQHHTGRALDIATPGCRPLTEAFEATEAFVWLRNHAARFGFRMPYIRNNRYGILYEPWHWSQLPD